MFTKTKREDGEVKKVYPMWSHNRSNFIFHCLITAFMGLVLYSLLIMAGRCLKVFSGTCSTTISFSSNEFVIIIGLAGILSILLNARARIVVREDGLEYHGFFDNDLLVFLSIPKPAIFSPWDNLSHIELEELRDSEGSTGKYHYTLSLKRPTGTYIDIEAIIDFPRSSDHKLDLDALVRSSFGQDLLKYAPHVIEETTKQQMREE